MSVYCRSCRERHPIHLAHGREMTKCCGMVWFVDRHPRTARPVPISGASKLTRSAARKDRPAAPPKEGA